MRVKNEPVWLYNFDYVKKGLEGFGTSHAMDMCWVVGIHCRPLDDGDRKIQSFDCRKWKIKFFVKLFSREEMKKIFEQQK